MIDFYAIALIFILGPSLTRWLNRDVHLRDVGGKQPGMVSGFLMGFAFAFGWTPCIGPILAGVLAVAATQATVGRGVLLLACYSAGLAIPFLLTAVGIGIFLKFYQKFRRYLHIVEILSGVMLLLIGVLIFTGDLALLSARFSFFNLENWIFGAHGLKMGVTIASALFAGLVSFLSPCVLPLVPGYVSMLSGIGVDQLKEGNAPRGGLLASASAFVVGFSIVFIAFGASASAVGAFLLRNRAALAPVAGALIILFGLHLVGVLVKIPVRTGVAIGAALVIVGFALGFRPAANRYHLGSADSSADNIGAASTTLPDEPPITFTNLDGAHVPLASLKGKVVLVNFWATWCDPCFAEVPTLITLQQKYGAKNFELLGVAMDDDGKSVVAPFVQTRKFDVQGQQLTMNYPIVLGNDDVTAQFGGLLGYPTTFVITPDGKIDRKIVGGLNLGDMETEIERLMR
jgi:cytochrome c biogenesis protein CcdA/thiol-disulfide isomerase/thioredoxin